MTNSGWVYVLTNPGLPGIVKLGLTTRDTSARAAELLREYGTVLPFVIASRHAVSDCAAVEAAAHRLLDRHRLPRSELFSCDVATAKKAVLTAATSVLAAPWWLRVWRRIWLPKPRPTYVPYRRRRRGSYDGLMALGLAAGLAAPVVLFKPALPAWLPESFLRVGLMLEHLAK